MLNNDYMKQAERDLSRINEEYTRIFRSAIDHMSNLQRNRERAIKTIQYVERYVVKLANKPRNFDIKIGEIQVRYQKFQNDYRELETKWKEEENARGFGLAGALGGVGLAALGPTAAMSVAMTFGTASTGTAIASLSGAAATNAALAWLGGGTLAAGGAGMAAGQAMLTLTGPVGWALGAASLAGSLLAINKSNKEIAQKTEESIRKIKGEIERIKEIDVYVLSLNDKTKSLSNAIMSQLKRIKDYRKIDCSMFSDSEMDELISLFNSTEVLSKLIGKTVGKENLCTKK